MLNPFIDLLADLIQIYMFCLMVWIVLTTLISFKIINANQTVVYKVTYALNKICMPALRPIQKQLNKYLGDLGGIDISPIILWLLLGFIRNVLYHYLYNL